jgi:hypothetical protein
MIAYHGTKFKFDKFKFSEAKGYYGKGIYFYPIIKSCYQYGNIIIECELDIIFDIIILSKPKELDLKQNSIIYINNIISEILVIDIDKIEIIKYYY